MNKYHFEIAAVVRFSVLAESEDQARLTAATLVDSAVAEELPVDFEALTEAGVEESYEGVCEPDASADLKLLRVEEETDA